jgi:site-specific DNA-methyltransferase (adenine-specific)
MNDAGAARLRVPTATSSFGTSRRENHDASRFYARFPPLRVSDDDEVRPCSVADRVFLGDSRDMGAVESKSVALVVTSPPYYSAKAYEEAMGVGHVPGSYVEFLEMLSDVFAECHRVLEPGGRIAVNVANLGRKPYRSLAKDVWTVLEGLGFLPRGEVVWVKAKGASGSAAFGSFAKASNPVLRDLTERILVASKGRFDRALHWRARRERGLPWESTISKEEFLAWTVDTWEMRTESARRVGHPAPFPVELPRRLIELYTYTGDVVLDPFLGAGTTAVAAVHAGRRYVGFDAEEEYVRLAEARIQACRAVR